MKWVSMAEQPQTNLRSRWEMPSVSWEWYKACHHWNLEQLKRSLWSVESRFTIWQPEGQIWV
jgi:hypothetical protein